ncbi:TatD family hydrolase [Tepidicella xavieri]|uniref:TatD DNase family protein n=1 Tax=Tepidicella xavieri TaxID=360241 RepID=A0A4R6U038_9BURK|nr:TatD family hydrolase [Tepidicella xavieri]TDQ37625.1 TatD DNase family protein [Tepidicella xavieri]
MWIDSHCHLDAPEWSDAERARLREQARAAGVSLCVLPAVERANWDAVRDWAHRTGDAYALGIHPLYVPQADEADLAALDGRLGQAQADERLVAVGEIGLDFFVPALCEPAMRAKQQHFYEAQLELACRHGLPVILHVRRSADALLRPLRERARRCQPLSAGIVHAFSGSRQQAEAFVALGWRLGFGGAATFETARRIRQLAAELPLSALVLETDAPDIPPQWLYVTAQARAAGQAQGVNTPGELPRIGAEVARLRGMTATALAEATARNACAALPRLQALWRPA